jgi:hypothetical protein
LQFSGAIISNGIHQYRVPGNRLHQVSAWGRSFVFLALIGFAAHAWPQQAGPPAASPAADSSLPAAPQVQASAAQAEPDAAATGSIRGTVVDPNGSEYEGARLALAAADAHAGPAPVLEETSDSSGRFSFTGVPAGAYKLTISCNGFATQVRSIMLSAGQSYQAEPVVLLVTTADSEVRVSASTADLAQVEVQLEEKQRVLGIIPNFYVAYDPHAPPLNTRQKFDLAWKTAFDPVIFLATGAFAGIEQADNTYSGYGQGAQGYGKRYGASFADSFFSDMIGNAVLPSLLKQDPRYFYKGTGTTRDRILYAIANAVICKGDNGHWQPNYSGIVGALAAGGISNLYYPAKDRNGATLTFGNDLISTAGSAVQNLFQEFVIRRLTPKLPSYGPSKP